jgi:hypothetical protein
VEEGADRRTLTEEKDATPINHVDVAAHPAWPRLTTTPPRPTPLAFFPTTMVSIAITRPASHRHAHHGRLEILVPRMVKARS